MEEWIKGNFRKSIYQNESGYVIGIFKVKEASSESLINYVGRTITFTGYFSDLNTNDTYLFYGKEIVHERYGNQFQVNHYEVVLPEETRSFSAYRRVSREELGQYAVPRLIHAFLEKYE